MTNKKTWIKVKRGLLEPKHRLAMGECWFLYLHILDRANWETGAVEEWKDAAEADQLSMPVETLRYQRKKLQNAGYITSEQRKHHQRIVIHKWIDPRKYDGEVINPPDMAVLVDDKGDNMLRPSEDADSKGRNKGLNKGRNKGLNKGRNKGLNKGRNKGIASVKTLSIKESHTHISHDHSSTTTPVEKNSGAFKAAVKLASSLGKSNPQNWAFKGFKEGWIWDYAEMDAWKQRDYLVEEGET